MSFSYHGSAKVSRGDVEAELSNVTLRELQSGYLTEWLGGGAVDVDSPNYAAIRKIMSGNGMATVTLPDGRQGDVIVTNFSDRSDRMWATVALQGSGEPPH